MLFSPLPVTDATGSTQDNLGPQGRDTRGNHSLKESKVKLTDTALAESLLLAGFEPRQQLAAPALHGGAAGSGQYFQLANDGRAQ